MTATANSLPLAKDLTSDYPRSARETLGGFALLARIVDKCRAVINGTAGEYVSGVGIDTYWFDFTGIDYEAFKAFVATGADDDAIAAWTQEQSKVKDRTEIVVWNNRLLNTRLSDLPPETQVGLDDYINKNLPKGSIVYLATDIYDIEEGRLVRQLKS